MKNANVMPKESKKSSKNGNKVNTATITPIAVSALSDFHHASFELAKLAKKHSEDKKTATAELEEAKKLRAKGASDSIAKALGKIDKIDDAYKKACAPWREKQQGVLTMVSDSFYWGYKIAMDKGDARATGNVVIESKDKKTTHVVKKADCFIEYVKDFLDKLGVSNLDNELAIDKVAKVLVARCSGRIADKRTGMTKDRNKGTQKDLFVRSVIEYLVDDRHALVATEDWHLVKKSDLAKVDAQ